MQKHKVTSWTTVPPTRSFLCPNLPTWLCARISPCPAGFVCDSLAATAIVEGNPTFLSLTWTTEALFGSRFRIVSDSSKKRQCRRRDAFFVVVVDLKNKYFLSQFLCQSAGQEGFGKLIHKKSGTFFSEAIFLNFSNVHCHEPQSKADAFQKNIENDVSMFLFFFSVVTN